MILVTLYKVGSMAYELKMFQVYMFWLWNKTMCLYTFIWIVVYQGFKE